MAGTITHQWSGTVLTITSDSGSSSADLRGEKGDDGCRGPQGAPGLNYSAFAYNHMDNSDFKVNQRGKEAYTDDGYTVDRWKASAGNTMLLQADQNAIDAEYRCIVHSADGATITSNTVIIDASGSENTEFRIKRQPVNYYGAIGDTAVFTVIASDNNAMYQWQHRTKGTSTWNNNTGDVAKTNTLTIGLESHRLQYEYRCRITGADGTILYSNTAWMVEGEPPFEITAQPENSYTAIGAVAKFEVDARGNVVKYQWQQKPKDGATWADIKKVEVTAEGIIVRGRIEQALTINPNNQYTLAACQTDGTIITVTGIPANGASVERLAISADNNNNVVCTIDAGEYQWTALYNGTYDAKTIPQYVQKGYAAELAECMRYYRQYNAWSYVAPGQVAGATAYAFICMETPMRAAPQYIPDGEMKWTVLASTGFNNTAVTGITLHNTATTRVALKATTTNAGNGTALITFQNNFGLSADL